MKISFKKLYLTESKKRLKESLLDTETLDVVNGPYNTEQWENSLRKILNERASNTGGEDNTEEVLTNLNKVNDAVKRATLEDIIVIPLLQAGEDELIKCQSLSNTWASAIRMSFDNYANAYSFDEKTNKFLAYVAALAKKSNTKTILINDNAVSNNAVLTIMSLTQEGDLDVNNKRQMAVFTDPRIFHFGDHCKSVYPVLAFMAGKRGEYNFVKDYITNGVNGDSVAKDGIFDKMLDAKDEIEALKLAQSVKSDDNDVSTKNPAADTQSDVQNLLNSVQTNKDKLNAFLSDEQKLTTFMSDPNNHITDKTPIADIIRRILLSFDNGKGGN